MNAEMRDSINKAIEENFPKAVGEILQKRLTAADQAETALAEARLAATRLTAELKSKNDDLVTALNRLASHADLDIRFKELEKRERDLEVAILKVRLEETNLSKNFARDVALGLVRNIEFRKQLSSSGSESVMVPSGNGYANVTSAPSSSSESVSNTAV